MRQFFLYSLEDVTGLGGSGFVAEGVRFSSGQVALSRCASASNAYLYDSIDDVDKIHGRNGKTQKVWDDLDFVASDGMPWLWNSTGFLGLGPDGGGPMWPNEQWFKDKHFVRPSEWVSALKLGRPPPRDAHSWAKMEAQYDRIVKSMHEAADLVAAMGR